MVVSEDPLAAVIERLPYVANREGSEKAQSDEEPFEFSFQDL